MLRWIFTSKRELIRPRPARELHPQHLVAGVGLLLITVVSAATFALVSSQREKALEGVRGNLDNAASLLAQQTDHLLNSVDVVTDHISDHIAALGISSPDEVRANGSAAVVTELLARGAGALPFLSALTITDDRGATVNSSVAWPSVAVGVSDPAFAELLQPGSVTEIIAATRLGHGEAVVQVARRLSSPDGQVSGLIVATVATSYIEANFRTVALPAGSSIALYRGDGALLATSSPAARGDRLLAKKIAALFEALPSNSSEAQASSRTAADGSKMIAGSARLPQYPLLVVATSPLATVLSSWQGETVVVGLMAALLNIAIIVAALLVSRQLSSAEVLVESAGESPRKDPLTGLANSTMFHEDLERAAARSERTNQKFSVLLIDLDHMKEVNDTQGYHVGDELLRAVAARIRRETRRSDTVARLNSDEFAIIQWNVSGPEETAKLAERLVKRLCEPFALRKYRTVVGVRIGAAFAPRDGSDADTLLKHADLALTKAEADGRHSFRFFSESMKAEHLERRAFAADLRQAFANGELELVFQPILNIASRQIGCFETLLRWHHPERGSVSPNDFIPVAEETGLIGPLGGWALKEACRQATSWPSHVLVAVNLSPVQMQTHDVYLQVSEALHQSGLAPERLEIEITESVALEHTDAGKALSKLRRLGVGVALDDFGTGYASLSYLRSFPFDRIKIDQSFVKDMQRQTESAAIVQTVIDLARRLGIVVTAEGVESIDQLEWLRALGCQKAQGYLIGPPLAGHEVAAFIAGWHEPGTREARPVLAVSN